MNIDHLQELDDITGHYGSYTTSQFSGAGTGAIHSIYHQLCFISRSSVVSYKPRKRNTVNKKKRKNKYHTGSFAYSAEPKPPLSAIITAISPTVFSLNTSNSEISTPQFTCTQFRRTIASRESTP